jgi:hypothetical protein
MEICPFAIFGIDKKSRYTKEQIKTIFGRKRKILHPKLTNGETELEYDMLKKSYKLLMSRCEEESKHEEIGQQDDDNFLLDASFNEIDFDNPECRRKLNLPVIEEKRFDQTEYSKAEVAHRNLFENKKFNSKDFNAVFEYIVEQTEVRQEDATAFYNSNVQYSDLYSFNGLIIDAESVSVDKLLASVGELDMIDESKLEGIDISKVRNKTKNIVALKKRAMDNRVKKLKASREEFGCDTSVPFCQMDRVLDDDVAARFTQDLEYNKDKIRQNKHMFTRDEYFKAMNNEIRNSSNCIGIDGKLTIPSGIRKE